MLYEWKLPDVGEGIHEAEILKWHVKMGDDVAVDQVMAEIQTDKAVVDIPSPVAGEVVGILAQEGELVRVGTVVIQFETADRGSDRKPRASVNAPRDVAQPRSTTTVAIGSRALATPAVRRLARELKVDIQRVEGHGEHGRVLAEDVRRYGEAPPPASPGEPVVKVAHPALAGSLGAETRVPLRGIRRTIAEHMVRSKFTAPHVTNMDEVEVSALVTLRSEAKALAESQGIKLTYLPFIIKAVVAALKHYPDLNASLDDEAGEIVLKHYYHIGIAVDDPAGLLVPVVRDADKKSLFDLAREIQVLTDKARAHTLTPAEMSGGTFTITNYGSFGGMFATPVINYPEVGIFGTGRIQKRAVVLDDDTLGVRPVMSLCLTFDHRVTDGGTAGRFTNQVMEYLHRPTTLFMEMS